MSQINNISLTIKQYFKLVGLQNEPYHVRAVIEDRRQHKTAQVAPVERPAKSPLDHLSLKVSVNNVCKTPQETKVQPASVLSTLPIIGTSTPNACNKGQKHQQVRDEAGTMTKKTPDTTTKKPSTKNTSTHPQLFAVICHVGLDRRQCNSALIRR